MHPVPFEDIDTTLAELEPALPSKEDSKNFLLEHADKKFQFVYVRSYQCIGDDLYVSEPESRGGLTICYSLATSKPGHSVIEVSLAWCHPNELFNKSIGRYFAAKRYLEGKTIPVHLKGNRLLQFRCRSTEGQLQHMFSNFV
jgi:hypothetical protein